MFLPLTVRVEIGGGKNPNSLAAIIKIVAEDGSVFEQSEPVDLVAGNTLTYGPVFVKVECASLIGNAKTPAPKSPPPPPAGTVAKATAGGSK